MAKMKKTIKDTLNNIFKSVSSLSLDDIKNHHQSIYDRFLKQENDSLKTREQSFKNSGLDNVVNNIRTPNYQFGNNDETDVNNFIKCIDGIFHLDNFIKNIRTDKGIIIAKFQLFDKLKKATTSQDVDSIKKVSVDDSKLEAKNASIAILSLFSILKNIQDHDNYPVNYKRWRFILKNVFKKNADKYEQLCDFYRGLTFPSDITRRDLGMSVYMKCIIDLIAKKIKEKGIDDSSLSKEYQKYFIREIDDIQEENVLENEKLIVEDKKENIGDNDFGKKNEIVPLNLILYGPPGTGKTYKTVDKALERLLTKQELDALPKGKNAEKERRKAQVEKFNSLKSDGRIVFTTFHQSMSYEDFIEGIKPITSDDGEVTYEVKPGIFKQICEKANPPQTDNFEDAWGRLLNELSTKNISIKNISGNGQFKIKLCQNGTSVRDTQNNAKTFSHDQLYRVYRGLSGTPGGGFDNYRRAVIEEMKKEPYCLKEYQAPMDNVKSDSDDATINRDPYVLIIDEINRGNVANIFGELITLIEKDKRLGEKEQLTVKLPYSNEEFGVPSNLYIIGTMNTADRSVEALDTALRRRFSFEEMMPDYNLDELNTKVGSYELHKILKTINTRIEVLKDRDHLIGHSYFMGLPKQSDGSILPDDLKSVFFDKIIPLLQEYFYGDYEKIQLVLGSRFIQEKVTNRFFAGGKIYDDIPEKIYTIGLDGTMEEALKELMNKQESTTNNDE